MPPREAKQSNSTRYARLSVTPHAAKRDLAALATKADRRHGGRISTTKGRICGLLHCFLYFLYQYL